MRILKSVGFEGLCLIGTATLGDKIPIGLGKPKHYDVMIPPVLAGSRPRREIATAVVKQALEANATDSGLCYIQGVRFDTTEKGLRARLHYTYYARLPMPAIEEA